MDDALLQPVLAAMLLSMVSAPFLIHYSDKLVRASSPRNGCCARRVAQIAVRHERRKHVVLCGYGRTGRTWRAFSNRKA